MILVSTDYISGKELEKEYDRVILCGGASHPRDIHVPGRDAKGIWFAVDFLGTVTKQLLDTNFEKVPYELAKGKNVLAEIPEMTVSELRFGWVRQA